MSVTIISPADGSPLGQTLRAEAEAKGRSLLSFR
jgi:hypothetical protein